MDEPASTEPERRWSRGRTFGVVWGVAMSVGIVALLVIGLARNNSEGRLFEQYPKENPASAPDFTLPVLFPGGSVQAGTEVSLSAFRGSPVVVNLWASWCVECRSEAPILEALWQRYEKDGVMVLGVNTQDDPGKALEFIAEYKTTFPSVRDRTDATQRRFQTNQLPETFVIDRQGKVRLVYRGGINRALAAEISDFLAREVGA